MIGIIQNVRQCEVGRQIWKLRIACSLVFKEVGEFLHTPSRRFLIALSELDVGEIDVQFEAHQKGEFLVVLNKGVVCFVHQRGPELESFAQSSENLQISSPQLFSYLEEAAVVSIPKAHL